MRLEDITVEVRNKSLAREGVIRSQDLDIEVQGLHSNVGTWRISLPAEHHLVDALRTPGSGIIVTGPHGVLLSGPTKKPEWTATPTDTQGSVIFNGVSDTVILADMLAWGGHLLASEGTWLAMKGKLADDELAGIPDGFVVRATHELHVPGLPAERHLLVLGRA